MLVLVFALHVVRRAQRTADELQADAEKLEGMVSGVRRQLQLSGLCEYVDVRARDHVNMKYANLLSSRPSDRCIGVLRSSADAFPLLVMGACTGTTFHVFLGWSTSFSLMSSRYVGR
jgi:hypothetical protein